MEIHGFGRGYVDTASDLHKAMLDTFRDNKHLYQGLVKEAQHILTTRLAEGEIKVAQICGRVKSEESLVEKIIRKNGKYSDPLNEITDLVGIRVVFLYNSDREAIEAIIRKDFQVLERLDKLKELDPDRFGYGALHFIALLGPQNSGVRYDPLKQIRFEIQVRTVLQDAWSTIEHHLAYKSATGIPDHLRRKLGCMAGLLETADDQFDRIRDLRNEYVESLEDKARNNSDDFLSQPANQDTLEAYLNWKFPGKIKNVGYHAFILFNNVQRGEIQTLSELDLAWDTTAPLLKGLYNREYDMENDVESAVADLGGLLEFTHSKGLFLARGVFGSEFVDHICAWRKQFGLHTDVF